LKGPPPGEAIAAVVDLQLSLPREERRALVEALGAAVADADGGPWRIRVSSTLVYLTPGSGSWWLKVRLTSATGETFTAILDPTQRTPALVRQVVAETQQGRAFTAVCSSCGRIRLEGTWHQREDLKAHARLTHGICPECAAKLYPATKRSRS
jgi:hypothetical protein